MRQPNIVILNCSQLFNRKCETKTRFARYRTTIGNFGPPTIYANRARAELEQSIQKIMAMEQVALHNVPAHHIPSRKL